MNYLGSNTFGIGTPATYPLPQGPWGLSTPFMGSYAIGGVQPLQQLLQIVPQQLQQVQYLQQLQAFHLQQLLQLVPTQLQLIQQLVQAVPQQIQQIQQLQQPWQTSPIPAQSGFGLVPPGLASLSGAPVSHVM